MSTTASGNSSANANDGKATARTAGRPYCPPRTICLYPQSNFRGTQRRYSCRGFPTNTRRDANLRGLFPPGTRGGVSSYQNARVPTAKLYLNRTSPTRMIDLPTNHGGNIAPRFNDKATDLAVIC